MRSGVALRLYFTKPESATSPFSEFAATVLFVTTQRSYIKIRHHAVESAMEVLANQARNGLKEATK